MCGIAGLVYKAGSNHAAHQEALKQMYKNLQHRGPDDAGFLSYRANTQPHCSKNLDTLEPGNIFFIHTRLAIVDPKAGMQPMGDPSQKYFIIYNGEIYNYKEVKNELQSYGYQFKTNTDTEVILTGYLHWKEKILKKLKGMFAFAILDIQKNNLFIARDHFGIKPLYYTHNSMGFFFASEIKALLHAPGMQKNMEKNIVKNYIRYNIVDTGEATFFNNIYKFPAANYAYFDLETCAKPTMTCYWDIKPEWNTNISEGSAIQQLRELFLHSLGQHSIAEVPLAAMLSGGIDSSSIVMGMKENNQGREHLRTFTYAAGGAYDETAWANIISSQEKIIGETVSFNASMLQKDIQDIIYTQDEPFGSASIFAQYYIFKAIKEQGIKVVLDGQGADELLGGYPSCHSAMLLNLIEKKKFVSASSLLKNLIFQQGHNFIDIMLRAAKITLPDEIQKLLRNLESTPYFKKENNSPAQSPINYPISKKNIFRGHLLSLFKTTNLPALLRFGDRNSMRFSIESRFPFLNLDLVEFIFTLPDEFLISGQGNSKDIFRKAMHGIVPDTILKRKDKIGFIAPEISLLREMPDWVYDCLNSRVAQELSFLDIDFLKKQYHLLLKNNQSPNIPFWRCLNVIEWARVFSMSV